MKLKLLFLILILLNIRVNAQSVVNTVHNLSASGTGEIKADYETEICIFCHTTHKAKPMNPMWNKKIEGKVYNLYSSNSLDANPSQPDGSSVLCLSCHDGTVAPGNIISRKSELSFGAEKNTLKFRKSDLTIDLSDDHAISFTYNSSLAHADGNLKDPAFFSGEIKLENEKLQCTSCHNPHKNTYTKFLNASPQYSQICLTCHDNKYWNTSSHKNSDKNIKINQNTVGNQSEFNTVAENACQNCHIPHSASSEKYLLKHGSQEANCINCHNGKTAETDIAQRINKPYSHNVFAYTNNHSVNENLPVTDRHVECEDCHNPHAAYNTKAEAPLVSGALYGVRAIDLNGLEIDKAEYEYEICFKCHADNPVNADSHISRQIEQTNTRLEFNPGNPSFHPVAAQGVNRNVQSLINPLNESSRIYCSSCHADNGSSNSGPHGSIYPHILKYNYSTAQNTPETYAAYELCYKCHDRNLIVFNTNTQFGLKVHNKHISELKTPCATCHDPHGISILQGNAVNNSNLINFNTAVVFSVNGILNFEDNGNFKGSCTLSCHGKIHNSATYN